MDHTSVIATLDVRKFTLDDIMQCLKNAGYIIDRREFEFARENDLFKYMGRSDTKVHKFMIGFVNDEGDGNVCYATMMYLDIGLDGTLQADYGGMPVFETMREDKLVEYFQQRCN